MNKRQAQRAQWLLSVLHSSTDECIEYPETKQARYVNIRHDGRSISAHRAVCEMAHGPAGAGNVARHSCDNVKCCNPRHLQWGSQSENINDALARGRFALGVKHGRAKLNDAAVVSIRKMRQGGASMNEIARQFDITRPCVAQVVSRKTWAHVA